MGLELCVAVASGLRRNTARGAQCCPWTLPVCWGRGKEAARAGGCAICSEIVQRVAACKRGAFLIPAALEGQLQETLAGVAWAWAFLHGEGCAVISAPAHRRSFPGSLWADDGVGKQGWRSRPAGYFRNPLRWQRGFTLPTSINKE